MQNAVLVSVSLSFEGLFDGQKVSTLAESSKLVLGRGGLWILCPTQVYFYSFRSQKLSSIPYGAEVDTELDTTNETTNNNINTRY